MRERQIGAAQGKARQGKAGQGRAEHITSHHITPQQGRAEHKGIGLGCARTPEKGYGNT